MGEPSTVSQNGKHLETEWVTFLRAAAKEIARVEFRRLTSGQRLIVGRYHALRWGNCSRDERRNRERGVQIASGIAGMATSQFADLTLTQYVTLADSVHEMRGGKPWFDPWLIKAADEPEVSA